MDLAPSLRSNGSGHECGTRCGPSPERAIALARVWTAGGVVLLLWLGAAGSPQRQASGCACAFLLYSLSALLALRKHRNWPVRLRKLLHGADLAWVVVFSLLLREPRTVLLAFLFVLIAAAQRWGPRRLVESGVAVALVVGAEGLMRLGNTLQNPLGNTWGNALGSASRNAPGVPPDALRSAGFSYVAWGVFALFAAGLLWLWARLEAAKRWGAAAQAAQRTRKRISMQLHDSVVQSLYTVDVRLERLRSRTGDLSVSALEDLTRLQELLQKTTVQLRDIVRQGRPLDLGSKTFVEHVRSQIAEFQQETGIAVNFVSDCEISPSPAVAGELVCIVQEALQNIRKHSGASNVSIGCRFAQGCWHFWVNDDGQGFDFTGRLGMLELESLAQGPFVIRERVSTLGGQLAVESMPGRGARLEIAVPKEALG